MTKEVSHKFNIARHRLDWKLLFDVFTAILRSKFSTKLPGIMFKLILFGARNVTSATCADSHSLSEVDAEELRQMWVDRIEFEMMLQELREVHFGIDGTDDAESAYRTYLDDIHDARLETANDPDPFAELANPASRPLLGSVFQVLAELVRTSTPVAKQALDVVDCVMRVAVQLKLQNEVISFILLPLNMTSEVGKFRQPTRNQKLLLI